MKIVQYEVNNLFNCFDHKISFNDDITIILGQNGLGKTAMLTMLHGLFSYNFSVLFNYPFASLVITFDNKQQLIIEKGNAGSKRKEEISFKSKLGRKTNSTTFSQILNDSEDIIRTIRRIIPIDLVRRYDDDVWQLRSTGDFLSTTEVISQFSSQFPQLLDINVSGCPIWLDSIIQAVKVDFIGTKRLQTQVYAEERVYSRRIEIHDTIEEYAIDFIKLLSRTKNQAANIAAEIDRTYPKRLIEKLNEDIDVLNIKQLIKNIQELEMLRNELIEVGLMDTTTDAVLNKNIKLTLNKEVSTAFSVYVEDTYKKLDAYNKMYQKVRLFINLINKHFLYKKIRVSGKDGFIIESTKTNDPISLKQLSSGEQHMFILYYHMLFKFNSDSLLLLDEPELSLHISWQKDFINDMLQIFKLNPMKALIATHSPSVVREHWSLTCELEAK